MNAKHKALTPEDFGLDGEQITELVTGAQSFLPPDPDPQDDERLVPRVDQAGAEPTS